MRVAKFGGALLRSADGVEAVCGEIRSLPRPLLVVVSAFASVTNRLEELARTAAGDPERAQELQESLVEHHTLIASTLLDAASLDRWKQQVEPLLKRLDEVVQGLGIVGELSPRTLDLVVHFGERLSSSIVLAVLQAGNLDVEAIPALDLIITDDAHRYARPNVGLIHARVEERLRPALGEDGIVLTEGYIGRGVSGEATTMGRESSDYTATLLGGLLGAAEVRLYTRVPGIMTADPAILDDARTIPRLGYQMARVLSELGVKVLHPRTVGPVEEASIPLVITDLRGHSTTIGPDDQGEHCSVALVPDAEVLTFHLPTVRADISGLLGRISALVPVLWHHQFRHTLQVVVAEPLPQGRMGSGSSGFEPASHSPCAVVSLVRATGITVDDHRTIVAALGEHPPIALQSGIDELSVSVAVDRSGSVDLLRRVHQQIG
jgi:aspartate kinase